MMYKYLMIAFTVISACYLQDLTAQSIKILSAGTNTSLRGLSVVNDRIIWVSGSNGTIGKSVDSGNTFKWIIIKDFEKSDFRDIEAFDEHSAVVMSIAFPAYILRTSDGGESWKVVYVNKIKGMFLDAMEFWNDQKGIVVGDPINDEFFIATTVDGGLNWRNIPAKNYPLADSGEACFASSGTNIRMLNKHDAIFVSGGLRSSLLTREKKIVLPVIQGKESTGANSIAVKNSKTLIVVGGDFNKKDSITKNCYTTSDGGTTWIAPITAPHGYRSCIEWIGKENWISCGLNGVDYSNDEGKNWSWISKESFHVCRKAKKGRTVFFAGSGGRIARLNPL